LFKFCRSHCANARTGLHYTHDSSFSPHGGLSTMRRDDTEALLCAPRHPGWAGNVLTVCGSAQRTALSCFTNYNNASMYLGPITIPRQGGGLRCIVLGLQPHLSRAPTDIKSKWVLSTRLLTIFFTPPQKASIRSNICQRRYFWFSVIQSPLSATLAFWHHSSTFVPPGLSMPLLLGSPVLEVSLCWICSMFS
jgi:hypothetical protein